MMVDTYTIRHHFEEWECGEPACCYEYNEWYSIEYKDHQLPTFSTEAEALYFILNSEGVDVRYEGDE